MQATTDYVVETARHRSTCLAAGPEDAPPIIFVHGWPELSWSWRHQLPVFAGLGFRCIAPDMRGYGRSSRYARHEDYALEHIVADLVDVLDSLKADKAVFVGHDWGAPAVWAMAQHHPDRCQGIANLCVPYLPAGFSPETATPLADRTIYPEARYPAAQWDYQYFYRENFEAARTAFEANVRNTVRTLFRSGNPDFKGMPAVTSAVRAMGGWFGPAGVAPDLPRDPRVLSQEDEDRYVAALEGSGFFGPDSWYMNAERNAAFAERAHANWRLQMPVLFLHGAYDYVCATLGTRLADPMREWCENLTEAVTPSGHWMAQEQPIHVNRHLAKWLATTVPDVWRD